MEKQYYTAVQKDNAQFAPQEDAAAQTISLYENWQQEQDEAAERLGRHMDNRSEY